MAVASSTASVARGRGPQGPVRTCIGCRTRTSVAELLRVAVAPDATGAAAARHSCHDLSVAIVPDPHRRIPGRGAWLHPDKDCVELAVRRRAFARALRVSGPVDPTPVGAYVAPDDPDVVQPAEPRRR